MLRKLVLFIGLLSVVSFISDTKISYAANDPSFACLDAAGPTQVVTGFYGTGKFEPETAPFKKFDARTASFEIPYDISWGKVVLRGSSDSHDMCWAGGYVTAALDWHDLDISWDQSKHGYDQSGTYRNTAAVESFHNRTTWTGLHIYNVHDGIRTTDSNDNWRIQHVWLDYIRDDCVENDHIHSGEIYDVLFDGCYVGFSSRPSSTGYSGTNTIIKMNKMLMRMEPMPYPYKWDTKSDPTFTVPGYGDTPFGYGNTFKLDDGNEPNFEITNSIFLHEYDSEKDIFPPIAKVTVCANNTLIWLGDPTKAPFSLLDQINAKFPGCLILITGKVQGKTLWKDKVADWHQRHPDVGVNRKPAVPGEYTWPRYQGSVIGDADGDGKVDGKDYLIWLSHYNQPTTNGVKDGDFDINGNVNGLDYLIWLSNYGS